MPTFRICAEGWKFCQGEFDVEAKDEASAIKLAQQYIKEGSEDLDEDQIEDLTISAYLEDGDE